MPPSFTRRQVLKSACTGFGYLALAGLLGQETARTTDGSREGAHGPLGPKSPHFPAKAKWIYFHFMQGATSQMDTWEY